MILISWGHALKLKDKIFLSELAHLNTVQTPCKPHISRDFHLAKKPHQWNVTFLSFHYNINYNSLQQGICHLDGCICHNRICRPHSYYRLYSWNSVQINPIMLLHAVLYIMPLQGHIPRHVLIAEILLWMCLLFCLYYICFWNCTATPGFPGHLEWISLTIMKNLRGRMARSKRLCLCRGLCQFQMPRNILVISKKLSALSPYSSSFFS